MAASSTAVTAAADTGAQRLRRLQHATAALSRTFEPDEIARELGRGVTALLEADGVFVIQVDLGSRSAQVLYQQSGGIEFAERDVALGDGAILHCMRTGEPFEASGEQAAVAASADGVILPPTMRAASLLVVPVMHNRRLLGVVGAHASMPNAFHSPDADAVRVLATQAAMALTNAQLFAESDRERRQTEALAEAARAVGESLRMGEVVRLILRHATHLLRGEGACVALREGNYLNVVAAVGGVHLLSGVHLPIHGSLMGRAVREATALISNHAPADPEFYHRAQRWGEVRKVLVAPLFTGRGAAGAIMVCNRTEDFGGEDARVLQRLADQASVAIVNARLFEEVTEASRAWTSTFDAISVGLVIVDDGGRIGRYNNRARQLASGAAPRELTGLPFYETILGGALMPNAEDPIGRALAEGTTARGTFQVQGEARQLQITAAPHLDRGVIVTFDLAPSPERRDPRGADAGGG
jgi:GAF domain-containing protein